MGKKYKVGSGDLLESTLLVLHLGQNLLLTQSWLHGVRGDLGKQHGKGTWSLVSPGWASDVICSLDGFISLTGFHL